MLDANVSYLKTPVAGSQLLTGHGQKRIVIATMRTNQSNNAANNNNYNNNNEDMRRRSIENNGRHVHRIGPYPTLHSLNRSLNNNYNSTSSLAIFSTSNSLDPRQLPPSLLSIPVDERPIAEPPAVIQPILMFPLGSESFDHLNFPNHVLHYSVSPSARFAYVVGQEANGSTNLYVWDLHRGVKHMYMYSRMYYIRHFYAIDDSWGYVVSSSSSLDNFMVYHVHIDRESRQISTQQHIKNCSARGHVFWSSCRYKCSGIVFAMIDQMGVYIYKVELGKCVDGVREKLEQSFFIDRNRLNNHYFIGQPFVHNEYVMFLEREYFNLKFTGRVVRISLSDGKMDCIETNLSPHCTLFANELMNGLRMPNRIKHVERDGQLWAIMESSPPSATPSFFSNSPIRNTPQKRKFIGVLCLKKWTWREVCLDVEASYDEMSLDVTSSGTVVIIKRGNCMNTSIVCGFYYIQTRNPKSLLYSSFHQLISEYEDLRFRDRQQLRALGVAEELL